MFGIIRLERVYEIQNTFIIIHWGKYNVRTTGGGIQEGDSRVGGGIRTKGEKMK